MNSSSGISVTPSVTIGLTEEDEPRGDWPYREAVGSLMRLSIMTRPDISNAACYGAPPSESHGQALEGSYEDYGMHSRDQGLGLTFVRGLGL